MMGRIPTIPTRVHSGHRWKQNEKGSCLMWGGCVRCIFWTLNGLIFSDSTLLSWEWHGANSAVLVDQHMHGKFHFHLTCDLYSPLVPHPIHVWTQGGFQLMWSHLRSIRSFTADTSCSLTLCPTCQLSTQPHPLLLLSQTFSHSQVLIEACRNLGNFRT